MYFLLCIIAIKKYIVRLWGLNLLGKLIIFFEFQDGDLKTTAWCQIAGLQDKCVFLYCILSKNISLELIYFRRRCNTLTVFSFSFIDHSYAYYVTYTKILNILTWLISNLGTFICYENHFQLTVYMQPIGYTYVCTHIVVWFWLNAKGIYGLLNNFNWYRLIDYFEQQ